MRGTSSLSASGGVIGSLASIGVGSSWSDVRGVYNRASDDLVAALGLRPAGVLPVAWSPGRAEGDITRALHAALDAATHGHTAGALTIQRVLLAGFTKPVREFYGERLLWSLELGDGNLCPDLLLDGTAYIPARHEPTVPTVFVLENKYLANWNVPQARSLYGLEPDEGNGRRDDIFGVTTRHSIDGGKRVSHLYNRDGGCGAFWHTSRRPAYNGQTFISALQLDLYIAYLRAWMKLMGRADLDSLLGADADGRAPLRAAGILLDAKGRRVTAWHGPTHERWTTTPYSALLAECALLWDTTAATPDQHSAAWVDAIRVLFGRMLYL